MYIVQTPVCDTSLCDQRLEVVSQGHMGKHITQEAQLSLTNCATLFCKVVEVLQDFLSENVDKKFTTDYNVA